MKLIKITILLMTLIFIRGGSVSGSLDRDVSIPTTTNYTITNYGDRYNLKIDTYANNRNLDLNWTSPNITGNIGYTLTERVTFQEIDLFISEESTKNMTAYCSKLIDQYSEVIEYINDTFTYSDLYNECSVEREGLKENVVFINELKKIAESEVLVLKPKIADLERYYTENRVCNTKYDICQADLNSTTLLYDNEKHGKVGLGFLWSIIGAVSMYFYMSYEKLKKSKTSEIRGNISAEDSISDRLK